MSPWKLAQQFNSSVESIKSSTAESLHQCGAEAQEPIQSVTDTSLSKIAEVLNPEEWSNNWSDFTISGPFAGGHYTVIGFNPQNDAEWEPVGIVDSYDEAQALVHTLKVRRVLPQKNLEYDTEYPDTTRTQWDEFDPQIMQHLHDKGIHQGSMNGISPEPDDQKVDVREWACPYCGADVDHTTLNCTICGGASSLPEVHASGQTFDLGQRPMYDRIPMIWVQRTDDLYMGGTFHYQMEKSLDGPPPWWYLSWGMDTKNNNGLVTIYYHETRNEHGATFQPDQLPPELLRHLRKDFRNYQVINERNVRVAASIPHNLFEAAFYALQEILSRGYEGMTGLEFEIEKELYENGDNPDDYTSEQIQYAIQLAVDSIESSGYDGAKWMEPENTAYQPMPGWADKIERPNMDLVHLNSWRFSSDPVVDHATTNGWAQNGVNRQGHRRFEYTDPNQVNHVVFVGDPRHIRGDNRATKNAITDLNRCMSGNCIHTQLANRRGNWKLGTGSYDLKMNQDYNAPALQTHQPEWMPPEQGVDTHYPGEQQSPGECPACGSLKFTPTKDSGIICHDCGYHYHEMEDIGSSEFGAPTDVNRKNYDNNLAYGTPWFSYGSEIPTDWVPSDWVDQVLNTGIKPEPESQWRPQIPQKVYEDAKYFHQCPMCNGYLERRGDFYTCQSCPFEYPPNGELSE